MSTLSTNEKKVIVAFLNEIAPDTFNEGEFGSWTFTSVAREKDEWRVAFKNSAATDGDVVTFEHASDALEANVLRQDWIDALNSAVLQWEGDMQGEA